MLKRFLRVTDLPSSASAALLVLRVVTGIAFIFHGWGKIQAPFSWMGPTAPVPGFLQALAALSEVGGGLAWILGLLTPLASLGIAATMAVAVATHLMRGDPFFAMGASSYEVAAVYLSISLVLLLVGPGRFSADAAIFGTKEPTLVARSRSV
ncbi:DoxX family protein [Sorangium sp. So ce1389]|uniref:DoxX family protein n=1 Tax=Sorangium sp. So ce1389 TaxID=3133336 RepID=UPI003F606D2D